MFDQFLCAIKEYTYFCGCCRRRFNIFISSSIFAYTGTSPLMLSKQHPVGDIVQNVTKIGANDPLLHRKAA